MWKLLVVAVFFGFWPVPVHADVSVEELRKLASAGISDPVILEFIKMHGPVQKLSADDMLTLKKEGASDKVLAAAVSSSGTPREAPSAPAPSQTEVVEKTVIVPEPTVVYDVDPYFYDYPSTYFSLSLGSPGYYVAPRFGCRPFAHRLVAPSTPRCFSPRLPCYAHHR